MEKLDLSGKKFGNWTVIRYSHSNNRGAWWLCRCDCGSENVLPATNLKSRSPKFCADCSPGATTHGMSRTREYHIWLGMKQRCHNPNDKSYPHYGGRGIYVCDRWQNSFENFIADMGPRPTPKHSLDRIDNNGPYSPENCRWLSQKEQANNTRKNTYVTFNGETKTLTQWAESTGISYNALLHRMSRNWPIEKMLTKPTGKMKFSRVAFNGETKSLKQWAREYGIKYTTLRQRFLDYNWDIERALTEETTFERGEILTFNGKSKSITQWAKDLGINEGSLRNRLYRGWSVEKALTKPAQEYSGPITFNGKTQSMKEWAKETGIGYSTLANRITTRGWPIERALTEPPRKITPRK